MGPAVSPGLNAPPIAGVSVNESAVLLMNVVGIVAKFMSRNALLLKFVPFTVIMCVCPSTTTLAGLMAVIWGVGK
jgi:hypothetical protein